MQKAAENSTKNENLLNMLSRKWKTKNVMNRTARGTERERERERERETETETETETESETDRETESLIAF